MIYKIIQKRKIFLTLSGLIITASLVALFSWGLNFGLDFTGGSLLEVKFDNYQPSVTDVQSSVQNLNLQSLVIQPTEDSIIFTF
jgi:preprotein translocase subunit SecF